MGSPIKEGGIARFFRVIRRPLRFGLVGGIGFIVAEILLFLGVLILTHGSIQVDSSRYASHGLLGLEAAVAFLSVAAGFFLNERVTVRNVGEQRKRRPFEIGSRLLKFEAVYALGNALAVLTQLALLAHFAISPVIGNFAGAAVAFPVNYLISMKFVWKVAVR